LRLPANNVKKRRDCKKTHERRFPAVASFFSQLLGSLEGLESRVPGIETAISVLLYFNFFNTFKSFNFKKMF